MGPCCHPQPRADALEVRPAGLAVRAGAQPHVRRLHPRQAHPDVLRGRRDRPAEAGAAAGGRGMKNPPRDEFDQAELDTGDFWILAKPGTQSCLMNVATDPPTIISFDSDDAAIEFQLKYEVPAEYEPRYIPPRTVN